VKGRRYTPEQVVRKLREADRLLAEGKSVAEVAKALEISEHAFGRWRNQYGGMKADDAKELRRLRDGNGRLKRMVGDQELDIQMSRKSPGETSEPGPPTRCVRHLEGRFMRADLLELDPEALEDLRSNRFDTVICIKVLEHIDRHPCPLEHVGQRWPPGSRS
jgi:putative transposase